MNCDLLGVSNCVETYMLENRVLPVSIFISSPGDVQEERQLVKTRIEFLQRNLAVRNSFRLDVCDYEVDVPPIVGVEPQKSVDRYLMDPADSNILICIMWSKLGSPFTDPTTGTHYPSGTVYEFTKAYERYVATGRQPIILFYKCTRAAEPNQAVEDFVNDLGSSGRFKAIYKHRTFDQLDVLAKYIDIDLQNVFEQLETDTREKWVSAQISSSKRRDDIIGKIRSIWMDGYLNSTFRQSSTLSIPYVYRSLAAPENSELANTGLSLKGHLRKSDSKMLFVASAGTGKSVAMCQLLCYLLMDAERSETSKIPILLDLSSWQPGVNLKRWIIEELDRLYLVGKSAAKRFLDNNEFIFLFDGIEGITSDNDEGTQPFQLNPSLKSERAIHFLEALNHYVSEQLGDHAHSLSLCLAVRPESIKDPKVAPELSKFFRASIELLELSRDDVDRFLRQNPKLEGLCEAVKTDHVLLSLALRPLFLYMMLIAYEDEDRTVILGGNPSSSTERIRELLARYCDRRLRSIHPEKGKANFTQVETRKSLSWIASRQNRTLFLMEMIQPDSMAQKPQLFFRILTSLVLGILLACFCTIPCTFAAFLEWNVGHSAQQSLNVALQVLCITFPAALLLASVALLFANQWKAGILLGITFGIVRGIVIAYGAPDSPLPGSNLEGMRQGVFTAVLGCLYFGVCFQLMKYDISRIAPMKTYSFRAKSGIKGIVLGCCIGALFWLAFGPARGITFGIAGSSIGFLLTSLNFAGVYVPINPNQGIVRSLRTANLVAMFFGMLMFLATFASYSFGTGDYDEGLQNGIRGIVGIVVWFMFGGIPVVQHYAMRAIAKLHYGVPIQMAEFLRFASRINLMQQIGGAFAFRHELIRDYFARMK